MSVLTDPPAVATGPGGRSTTAQVAQGYAGGAYARSFPPPWTPRRLPRSGGWLLERPVAGDLRDATGTYPLLSCLDWDGLPDDLAGLEQHLVSVCAVADPLGDHDPVLLRRAFPDLARPFKQHHVADLSAEPAAFVDSRHRAKALRAARAVEVEVLDEPATAAPAWVALYENLVVRHGVRGIAAFPASSLAAQLSVDGALAVRAVAGGTTVAMTVWYLAGDRAWYHLGASSDEGYALGASFALFWTALHELRRRDVRFALLGAGAGVDADGSDGLARFKRGWSNTTRTAWLCGRILDPAAYAAACAAVPVPRGPSWFPAYRWQEGACAS